MARVVVGFVTTVFVLVMAGLGAPVRADKPPAYFVDETKLPFDALSGTTTTRLWGVQGGAGYRIEVPANWNGELVLYAHGFRGGGLELTVSNPPIRRVSDRARFRVGGVELRDQRLRRDAGRQGHA